MKKGILLWMIVVVAVFSTACGGGSKEKEQTTGDMTVTEKPEETQTQEQTREEEPQAAAPLKLQIDMIVYDAGESEDFFSGMYDKAEVAGDDYPALKNALHSWSEEYEKNFNTYAAADIEDAKKFAEEMQDDFYGFSRNQTLKPTRLDAAIASISMDEYIYLGGAHDSSYLSGITFDTQTGKELLLEDLGDIKEDIRAYLSEYIKEHPSDLYNEAECAEVINTLLDTQAGWYLDGLGLIFVFNEYEINSYAAGRTLVRIPYHQMPGFKEEYLPVDGCGFAWLSVGEDTEIDVDGDGSMETVCITETDFDNSENPITVKIDGTSVDLEYGAYISSIYYVKNADGKSYILLSYDMASDDYVTQLLEVDSKVPVKCDEVTGFVYSITNSTVDISANLYVLGTYIGYRCYGFDTGKLVALEERYTFDNAEGIEGRRSLKLITDLLVKLDTDGQMVDETLPAGTILYPCDTDDETVFGFVLEDGRYGELVFERADMGLTIDGVSEFDIFEELPYAG